MTIEWLEQRSLALFGKIDSYLASSQLRIDAGVGMRKMRTVYIRDTDEQPRVVMSMAENTCPEAMRDPPEAEVEVVRKYLGAEGRPLWYDVA